MSGVYNISLFLLVLLELHPANLVQQVPTVRVVQGVQGGQPVQVEFISVGSNLSVKTGEDVMFNCNTRNLGGLQILWRKGYAVISAGEIMISLDSRLSLITGGNRNSLLLKNVTEQDDGEYSCQITAQTGVLTLTHSLTVLVPPTAEVKPGSGEIRVEEGARVKLECVVTGIPFPLVRWFKKNKPVSGVHNSCPNQTCITLPAVDRSSAGQYVCQASNGIGETASASIDVLVQYGPVVKVHEPSVQGGSGKQIQLACQASGEPKPDVVWLLAGSPVKGMYGLRPEYDPGSDSHNLIIERSDSGSFGNYTCQASNSVGTISSFIEVHGRPSSPLFKTSSPGGGSHSRILSWITVSYYPLTEYRILYKQLNRSEWISVSVPGNIRIKRQTQGEYEVDWSLNNLNVNTDYDSIIQARNIHGWGNPSNIFTFTTNTGEWTETRTWETSLYSSSSSILTTYLPFILLPCILSNHHPFILLPSFLLNHLPLDLLPSLQCIFN